jgi:hypothetical protein
LKAFVKSLLTTAFFCGAFAANASSVLYSNVPNPLPWNVPSQAYEATSTSEFGGLISFAGPNYSIDGATVVMSNWALKSLWDLNGDSTGFNVPLTLNLYGVDAANTVGALLATNTADAFIPWRPEATGCDGQDGYDPGDGGCYHGLLAPVSFKFDNVIVPQQIIFGLAFNTQHYGQDPTGVSGPYNSLNFALSTGAPTVGSNPLPGTVYWKTTYEGGTNTFGPDAGWGDYAAAIQVTGTPEPTTCLLLGGGLVALSLIRRRRRA